MPPIAVTADGNVAVFEITNPPVNALSAGVPDALAAALAAAERDPAVQAIVILGGGKTFVAGADIKELEKAAWDPAASLPDMHDLLGRIEDCRVPVVMAIHGTALGGGLELAMAGHYRVAVASARIGQPEVNLGIIPGAEGTQRLPRLAGIEKAIELCVAGNVVGAAEALDAGILDRLVGEGNLKGEAIAFAREMAGRQNHPRTRERLDRLGDPERNAPLYAAGRQLAARIRRNQQAPLAAVAAIEAAATLPFEEGCRRERALFDECVRTDQCKALVHVFLAERTAARIPDLPASVAPLPVTSVGIVGAGTMGSGIAVACANAGLAVRLTDSTPAALERGMAAVRRTYESAVKRGRLTPADVDARLARITPQLDFAGFESADLAIEAVFERMALKQDVFAQLDRVVRTGAVLATNTSTLDVDAIASATGRPRDVIGLHFFSPAHVMRLVEIVRGSATSPDVIATAFALARRLGKVGVLVRNREGFVGNRMMFPYMYEAQFLVEEGTTPAQVDAVLTGWGMAMGIFAVDDLGGLDVAFSIRQGHDPFAGAARRPLVADRLVAMGRLGQKTGAGWYRYGDDRKALPDPEVESLIERAAREAGIARRTISDDEILDRTVLALVNEGARVLDDGVALRASDIDVIYTTGYGFPAYRGGPMFHADLMGLPQVLERLQALHRVHGDRWRPAPLIERLARDGSSFRAFDAARVQESQP